MCLYLSKKEKVPVAVPLSDYLCLKNLSPAGRKTTLFPGDRMHERAAAAILIALATHKLRPHSPLDTAGSF